MKNYSESWILGYITTILDEEGYTQRVVIDNEIREVPLPEMSIIIMV